MKFPQLPVGARFRYQGEIWCKTGPLAASGAGGASRMIPRSASIEPVEGDASTPSRSPRQQALADHHQACSTLLREAAEAGPQALPALRQRLEQAHAALVAAVG